MTQTQFEELLDQLPDYDQASAIANWEIDNDEERDLRHADYLIDRFRDGDF